MSIYEYLIKTLSKLNLIKVYEKLNKENNFVDEIKADTLKLIDSFEQIDTFDPRLDLNLNIKLVVKFNGKIVLEKKKNKYGLITFNPTLIGSIDEQIKNKIKEVGEAQIDSIKISSPHNAYDLVGVNEESKRPTYIVTYVINIKEFKSLNKKYILSEKDTEVDEIDSKLIERS